MSLLQICCKGEIMSRYVAVNIRREYADLIDSCIENDPLIPTRAEFIRRSIEEKLKKQQGAG